MDIELARTFLSVLEAGTFNHAAERLNVTQSTVSTRIRTIENQLGRVLFVRSRAGTFPTGAGRQFHPYALNLVKIWQQAQQEIALPAAMEAILAIGGQLTLWERLLLRWIPWARDTLPDMAVRVEVGSSDGLMQQLRQGILDIGVMYTPQSRPGLTIEKLLVERLVLVSSSPATKAAGEPGYIYVDWGPEFRTDHSNAFPDMELPVLVIGYGPLALRYILEHGGAGYFPQHIVQTHIQSHKLHRVRRAPTFSRPAYLVYSTDDCEQDWFKTALQGLHYVATLKSAV
ncbi:MAG: LysR family transcriptional regulator [Rhodospirillaceae bacterium]|nr:LysR family transcriptional regulator [Rhodospirillaceae bacterium]MBL6941229.1 LysR family transcriptional regulator [Rhodospirillales bacterium]